MAYLGNIIRDSWKYIRQRGDGEDISESQIFLRLPSGDPIKILTAELKPLFDGVEEITFLSSSSTITSGKRFIQDVSGIETTLPEIPIAGQLVSISNYSGGANTIIGTVRGDVNPQIVDGETFDLLYTGTEWGLV